MSINGKRTIYVGSANPAVPNPLKVEGLAIAAVAPGTLLTQSALGLAASTTAATVFGEEFLVADKDEMRSRSVDDAWTIAETMVAILPVSGDFLNVLVVTGQALIQGTPLARNGAGLLKIAVTPTTIGATSEEVVAFADEVVTTTATQLVRVRKA